jgi:hypothetical protein
MAKAQSRVISFRCKVKYPQIFEDNRDMGDEETEVGQKVASMGGAYKIMCYPDDLNDFVEKCTSGTPAVNMTPMGNQFIKNNDEGEYVTLRRWHNPPTSKDGEVYESLGGAPRVVDADGYPWDTDTLIGNGSECEVAFDVWGKGWTKLRAIKVVDLVEYEASEKDPSLDWVFS